MSNFPKSAHIVDVGPRDGLQNEKENIPTDIKIEYIKKLAKTGLKEIEVTSFVSPRAIPQLADSSDVYSAVKDLKITKPVLVPNMKGLENAISVGVSKIAVFTATSESFNKKNINATIDESFERITPVVKEAQERGLSVRGYISTAFVCPYEGKMSVESLLKLIQRLKDLGISEISIGDTIGAATTEQVDSYLEQVKDRFGVEGIALHFHDTQRRALENLKVGLSKGFSIIDSSSGGLGGCPYAKGATGNVATEDVLYLLDSLNIEHGVSLEKIREASAYILSHLNKNSQAIH
jgi:hydroxymethylglutaryl-CoA lyase